MTGYECAACGARHEEIPLCFKAPMPAYAAQVPEAEFAARVELSSDLCMVDAEHFFILGNLDIPIIGHEETVRWSVWSSLSAQSFRRVVESWEVEGREQEPPYFGWLSTDIPGYAGTLSLPLGVHTQEVGVRPRLVLQEPDHLLFHEQSNGISWQRALELSRAALR